MELKKNHTKHLLYLENFVELCSDQDQEMVNEIW